MVRCNWHCMGTARPKMSMKFSNDFAEVNLEIIYQLFREGSFCTLKRLGNVHLKLRTRTVDTVVLLSFTDMVTKLCPWLMLKLFMLIILSNLAVSLSLCQSSPPVTAQVTVLLWQVADMLGLGCPDWMIRAAAK